MTDQRQSLDAPVADNSSTINNNGSAGASPQSSTDSRASSANRNQPARLSHISSNHNHRQSFSESLRTPSSPRSRRQPSLPHSAIQSLIDNPPVPNGTNPKFSGRDWRHISIGEVVSPDDLRWVEEDTGIEEATNVSMLLFFLGLTVTNGLVDSDRFYCCCIAHPRKPPAQVGRGHV